MKDKSKLEQIIHQDLAIKRALTDPRISRREFLSFAGALGMSTALGSSLWSGRALAAGPKRGGHMVSGLNDATTVDSLDSGLFNATYMICVSRAFRDSLVNVGQDNSMEPALAESWEASADAKVWRYNIRQGVEFHNGKSLTTDDVVASINMHRGDDTPSAAKGVFSGISDVRVDGNTVVVELADGNADCPALFTDYHFGVVPAKDGKADVLSSHGTGPYLLKEYDPGVKTTLDRNPNAWHGDNVAHADSHEVIAILDDTARQSALISGSVDIINRPALKGIDRLKKVKGVNILAIPSNLAFTHPMRMDVPPFDNNDLRMALKLSTPRQEFMDKVLFGYGVMGNDQPLGPQFPSYDADLKPEYDLDKAKYHLKKAGLEGVKIDLSASNTSYGGAMDAAQLFQSHWGKIGVNLNIVREPQDGYWTNVWNVKPFCTCYWGPRPVEDMILSICYLSDSPWNDTLLKNARVDELVVAARGELDQNKRVAMYQEVQHIIAAVGGTIIPAFGTDVAATRDTIGVSDQVGGGWEMDGGHFLKRWWKA